MTTLSAPSPRTIERWTLAWRALAALGWLAAYKLIQPLANWITYLVLGLAQDSRFGESLAFFLYDVPRVILLLTGMVFVIAIIRSFFSPERTRAMLGGQQQLRAGDRSGCSGFRY